MARGSRLSTESPPRLQLRANRRSGSCRAARHLVLAIVAASSGSALADVDGGGPAVLNLVLESGKERKFGGILAEWSAPEGKVSGTPLVKSSEENQHGCNKQQWCPDCAILVHQGECPFAIKARRAEAAGAKLMIVVGAEEGPPVGMSAVARAGAHSPQITSVMVSKTSGRQIILLLQDDAKITATTWKTEKVWGDILSELVVGGLAVSLVMLGAWHSVEDLRTPATKHKFNEECFAVEEQSGLHFVVFGSLMLTVLFFFMKYLIYGLLFLFATGAVSTTTMLLEPLIGSRFPQLRAQTAYSIPKWLATALGVQEDHSRSDVIAELVGVCLAVNFLIFRNNVAFGWMLQDTIAIMLLLTIQRSLRLPNLKVGTTLLIFTFFFDIFWVFISPLIFKKSVMIEVATGGGTGQSVPMVLKIPAMSGDLPGQFKILGLGDIAIPGLLLSLLLRHDLTQKARRCSGYFTAGVIGYSVGLAATFVSLYVMKHGQPALLFLVPGTLLPTFGIALRKGELGYLWSADYGPEQQPEEPDNLMDPYDGVKDFEKHD